MSGLRLGLPGLSPPPLTTVAGRTPITPPQSSRLGRIPRERSLPLVATPSIASNAYLFKLLRKDTLEQVDEFTIFASDWRDAFRKMGEDLILCGKCCQLACCWVRRPKGKVVA